MRGNGFSLVVGTRFTVLGALALSIIGTLFGIQSAMMPSFDEHSDFGTADS